MIAEQFLVSPSKRPPLRIGLLLDGLLLPRCFEQVIDHIQKSNFAKIELLMIQTLANAELVKPRPPEVAGSKGYTFRSEASEALGICDL